MFHQNTEVTDQTEEAFIPSSPPLVGNLPPMLFYSFVNDDCFAFRLETPLELTSESEDEEKSAPVAPSDNDEELASDSDVDSVASESEDDAALPDLLKQFKSTLAKRDRTTSLVLWRSHPHLKKWYSGRAFNLGSKEEPTIRTITDAELIRDFKAALSGQCPVAANEILKANPRLAEWYQGKISFRLNNEDVFISTKTSFEHLRSALPSRLRPIINIIFESNPLIMSWGSGKKVNIGASQEPEYLQLKRDKLFNMFKSFLLTLSEGNVSIYINQFPHKNIIQTLLNQDYTHSRRYHSKWIIDLLNDRLGSIRTEQESITPPPPEVTEPNPHQLFAGTSSESKRAMRYSLRAKRKSPDFEQKENTDNDLTMSPTEQSSSLKF